MSTTSQLPDLGVELREGYAEVGDQRLHYVEAGEGPLVLLQHGFPEFWFGWRLQIEPLAAADVPVADTPPIVPRRTHPVKTATPRNPRRAEHGSKLRNAPWRRAHRCSAGEAQSPTHRLRGWR